MQCQWTFCHVRAGWELQPSSSTVLRRKVKFWPCTRKYKEKTFFQWTWWAGCSRFVSSPVTDKTTTNEIAEMVWHVFICGCFILSNDEQLNGTVMVKLSQIKLSQDSCQKQKFIQSVWEKRGQFLAFFRPDVQNSLLNSFLKSSDLMRVIYDQWWRHMWSSPWSPLELSNQFFSGDRPPSRWMLPKTSSEPVDIHSQPELRYDSCFCERRRWGERCSQTE